MFVQSLSTPLWTDYFDNYELLLNEELHECMSDTALQVCDVGVFLYTAFTLATSELGQTGLVLFLEVDTSTTAGTSQVPVTLLISTFEIKLNQSGPVLKLLV